MDLDFERFLTEAGTENATGIPAPAWRALRAAGVVGSYHDDDGIVYRVIDINTLMSLRGGNVPCMNLGDLIDNDPKLFANVFCSTAALIEILTSDSDCVAASDPTTRAFMQTATVGLNKALKKIKAGLKIAGEVKI
jgi:hypothetical protein